MDPYAHNSVPPDSHSSQNEPSSTPSSGGSSPAEPDCTPTPPQESLNGGSTLPDYASTFPGTASPPRIVGKYMILEEVQVGGMGIVYKARDQELDRIVALKMIKGGLLASAEEIARFRHEARAAARLDHPNIIPVYEIDQEEGRLYFTMAFAWGGSLAQRQGQFVSDPRAAAALLEKIARAVHYAHQGGVLHRDLKPANILFDERGNPWVCDFGLAKFVDASLELTRTGQMLGTPAYMAPEQADGQTDQVSVLADVWALGVLLYELLTGKRPFQGESQEEQLRKVRTAEPPRPRTVNRSLDRALETVILKCLEKEPARRYASAEAVADDLARWLRGEPVLARPPSWLVRTRRAMGRYRTLAFRVALALVLLVLLALAWKGISPSVPPAEEGERRALEEKNAELRQGKKVTLLGKSGPPGWWRWQPHRTDARTMLDMDQVFRVQAGKHPGMLELLPNAPKRFCLHARIQHCEDWGKGTEGRVGIYFAHGTRRTEEGVTHCFFKVAFNDRVAIMGPRDDGGAALSQVSLTLPVYREKKGGVFFRQLDASCDLTRQFPPAGKIESMPWRSVKVEVTPEKIKLFWEGEQIATSRLWGQNVDSCDPKMPLLLASRLMGSTTVRRKDGPPEPAVVDAEPGLGDGLGLYVEQGIAAFQSVVIEPLTP